jgi:hypothetical protein
MPALRDAVMWLDSIPAPTAKKLERGAAVPRLVMKQSRSRARVTVVPADRPVRIENHDDVYHLPFTRGAGSERTLGALRGGSLATFEVPCHGVVCLYCRLHSREQWWIRGVPTDAWGRADQWGRFRLPAMPNGHYVVHAWHPVFGETSAPVEVCGLKTAEIELRFRAVTASSAAGAPVSGSAAGE